MNLLLECLVLVVLISSVHNEPRSRSNKVQLESKYDQKQTGDYNIQVHLKDFQLLALLAGQSDLGDYEYVNYDYADMTVKPSQSSSTENSSSNSTEKPSDGSTERPSDFIYITSEGPPKPALKPQITLTSVQEVVTEKEKPVPTEATTQKVVATTEKVVVTTEKVVATTEKVVKPPVATEAPSSVKPPSVATRINNKVGKVGKTNDEDELEVPEEHHGTKEEDDQRRGIPVTNIAIIPLQGKSGLTRRVHLNSRGGHGVRVKKCGHGYARDKRGRCRKLKRYPPAPPPKRINRISNHSNSRFRSPNQPH